MKTLILVRHAKTEQLSYNSTKTDFERELKPRGFSDTELICDDLIEKDIKPDLLISSTAVRAKQTADIIADNLGIDRKKIVRERFIYDGYTTSEFIGYLSQYNNEYNTIMVVGHNPEIAMMAINLTDDDEYLHFPTTATIAISFEADTWENVNARDGKKQWLITPRMFKNEQD